MKTHLKYVRGRVALVLNGLYHIGGAFWGLRCSVTMTFYQVVVNILRYVSPTSSQHFPHQQKKGLAGQSSSCPSTDLLCVTGAYRMVSPEVVQVLAESVSINLLRKVNNL